MTRDADGVELAANGRVLRFRNASDAVYDVRFDGRRIWSLDAAEVPASLTGWREIAWPPPLKRQLDGLVTIELVDHLTGESVASLDARFGTGTERISIVDAAGHPAALTKWGKLVQPFATTDRAAIEAYLDQVEDVLAILRDECGVPAFLSFGSLLGGVRSGGVIPHDVDVDLGYLSAFDNPVDVMLESFRIERRLRDRGIRVTRNNGGFVAMYLPQPDGTKRNLDIFTAYLSETGRLHQINDVDTEADVSAVLPLGSIDFEGRPMPVPAKPEVFLVSAYGPDWRVPNPAFSFERPRRQRRRVRGWFGGLREDRDEWARFYTTSGTQVPDAPSSFAEWVAKRESPGRLVDLGSGNGRDTVFFAQRGFQVIGVDAVMRQTRRRAKSFPKKQRAKTRRVNLDSVKDTLLLGAELGHQRGGRVVYARFLLHALSDHARENAWRLMSMALSGGGRGYLEFRTHRDASLPKHFRWKSRRFLNPADMQREAARFGLRVVEKHTGRGWSPLGNEDPHLCRMVVEARKR